MRKTCGLICISLGAMAVAQLGQGSACAAAERTRILYLGDSMSMGAFGSKFDQEMREDGFEVYTFVAGGATPYYWLSRYSTITGPIGYWEKTPGGEQRQNVARGVPKVETLLERYDPDVVVVQTGTNLYSSLRSKRRSKENNVKEVEGLLGHMVEAATQGGRRCYWITPPAAHPDRYPFELQAELAELTKRVVSQEAKVFDSRRVTKYIDPYPANDGIHYGPTEARQWASLVVEDFRQFMVDCEPVSEGMLAGANTPKCELEAVDYRQIPRAVPVSSVASVAKQKQAPAQQSSIAEAIPPTKPRKKFKFRFRSSARAEDSPPETPEKPSAGERETEQRAQRPPVQYVKKAISIDTEGVKWGKLDLELRLVAKSELRSLKDVDYSYCFALNEYEVLKVNSGYYPHPRIRIARVVMWGKKPMHGAINEPIGYTPAGGFELVPMSNYPRFEQMQLVDDLPIDLDLPTYIIAFE